MKTLDAVTLIIVGAFLVANVFAGKTCGPTEECTANDILMPFTWAASISATIWVVVTMQKRGMGAGAACVFALVMCAAYVAVSLGANWTARCQVEGSGAGADCRYLARPTAVASCAGTVGALFVAVSSLVAK